MLDEDLASALCYTSGTTGRPKGVLYSHRSTVLHAYAVNLPDVFGLRATDRVMPVVPMFHVNGWGIPYAAPLGRRQHRHARPAPRRRLGPSADERRAGHDIGRRADGLARPAAAPRGERRPARHAAAADLRRVRLPADDHRHLPRQVRRHRRPCLGHDRDEPARHLLRRQARSRGLAGAAARAPALQAGPRRRRASTCASSTTPAGSCRGTA